MTRLDTRSLLTAPWQQCREPLINSGLKRLFPWGSASFDFASLRSGRTEQLFRVSEGWFGCDPRTTPRFHNWVTRPESLGSPV